MKTSAIKVVLASVVALSSSAFASGFRCESPDGYRVKIYNHVQADNGTRVPAVLVVSHAQAGTLLSAKGTEISKRNLSNLVQYSAKGPKGGLTYAVVQIAFKEGRDILAEGERAYGTLVLAKGVERQTSRLTCHRYLKQ
jgi:hypothetical protein